MHALDPTHLLDTYGIWGIYAVIFAETGLLIGFFLPGDSLLVTAGLLASTGKPGDVHLNLAALLVGCAVAAVAGAQAGFVIGRRVGPALFRRPDSRIFKQRYVERTHETLARYGAVKAIVLARFIPVVRTFLNPVAGVGGVDTGLFTAANLGGGVAWTTSMVLLGYTVGSTVKGIDRYLVPAIIVISVVPVALEVRRARRERATA
ncbi:MAG TPA: VTT domain-containing protein [Acidimicrobiales bacterium]